LIRSTDKGDKARLIKSLEVKRSKIKVTRQDQVWLNSCLGILKVLRLNVNVTDNLSGEGNPTTLLIGCWWHNVDVASVGHL